jgi:uncharacterized membrane protein YphA (DoxX/SURF4 family)
MRRLGPGAFTFRARLGAGDSLGSAADADLAGEPSFDVAAALAALFADEYRLPLLPPELAARLAMMVEIGVPLLLFAWLATRLATLPLIAMTLVIVTFVCPASWVESLLWGRVLVMILTRGPGVISLDHLIERWFTAREQGVPSFHPARA